MTYETDSIEKIRQLILEELSQSDQYSLEFTRGLFARHDGSVARLHLIFGKICSSTELVDICGSSTTGNDGTTQISIKDFVCIAEPKAGQNFELLTPPVFFVATPKSDSPTNITFQVNVDDDVQISIKVFTWNSAGEPAAKIRFDWRCCLQLTEVVG